MFRIRRIYDDSIARDRGAIAQAQEILRSRFSGLKTGDIEKLPRMLKNPLKYRFRTILLMIMIMINDRSIENQNAR